MTWSSKAQKNLNKQTNPKYHYISFLYVSIFLVNCLGARWLKNLFDSGSNNKKPTVFIARSPEMILSCKFHWRIPHPNFGPIYSLQNIIKEALYRLVQLGKMQMFSLYQ